MNDKKKPSSCARCVDGKPIAQAECLTFTGKTRLVWLCAGCHPFDDSEPKKRVKK